MIYLTNTFSPMMLSERSKKAVVVPKTLEEIKLKLNEELISAISHDVTAKILSALLGKEIPFRRVGLSLEPGDILLCVIPQFRASEAREFTYEEVANAGFKCFMVVVEV